MLIMQNAECTSHGWHFNVINQLLQVCQTITLYDRTQFLLLVVHLCKVSREVSNLIFRLTSFCHFQIKFDQSFQSILHKYSVDSMKDQIFYLDKITILFKIEILMDTIKSIDRFIKTLKRSNVTRIRRNEFQIKDIKQKCN